MSDVLDFVALCHCGTTWKHDKQSVYAHSNVVCLADSCFSHLEVSKTNVLLDIMKTILEQHAVEIKR